MSQPFQQFDEIARKAALGELSRDERDWLDAFLREHPERRADLDWDRAFHARLEEKVAEMPAMPGWEQTQRVMAASQAAVGVRPRSAREPALLDRLSNWLQSSFGWVVNVQAVAAALVIAQAAVIGMLVWEYRSHEYSEIRTGAQTDAQHGPVLRISFRDDIREAELRKALADIGGEIVGGPGQIGVYLIRVKNADLGAAAERLRATGLTVLVEVYEPK